MELLEVLGGVVRQHPQKSYAGMKKYLQQEWYFIQRINQIIGDSFRSVEEALQNSFLPSLFQGAMDKVPTREITRLPGYQAGMAIPNQKITWEYWTTSCVVIVHMFEALQGRT